MGKKPFKEITNRLRRVKYIFEYVANLNTVDNMVEQVGGWSNDRLEIRKRYYLFLKPYTRS